MSTATHPLGRRSARRLLPFVAALVLVSWAPPVRAADNWLEMPISQAPAGVRLNPAASHRLTPADIAAMAGAATAGAFRLDGWRMGYEERLESSDGCRVLIDAFVFATDLGTRMARTIWTASTPGERTLITHLPTSAQEFQGLVRAPGTPGWDVQIIFRIARTLVNVDSRCNGIDDATRLRARALGARITRRYDAWIATHAPR